MQRFWTTVAAAMLWIGAGVAFSAAQEGPQPTQEHRWLERFLGEWETEMEMVVEPGKPPEKFKGTESTRPLGGFFVVAEGRSEVNGVQGKSILTLGYDTTKKKYVGTWIDSCLGHLWNYEGQVEVDGETLTLYTEGPSMLEPGKTAKYREATEFKSKDHRVFTSAIQRPDGKWQTLMTVDAKRKK